MDPYTFYTDPDPAFFLNTDPDPDPNTDPDQDPVPVFNIKIFQ